MKVIGYHIAPNIIANSEGAFQTEPPYLDFLMRDITLGKSIKVLYNMDYSVACLLRMIGLSEEQCKELWETKSLWMVQGYELDYIPGRWFSVKLRSDKAWAGFSDMSQYEPDYVPEETDRGHCLHYANMACSAGQAVCSALERLELYPKSLTSPIAVYEKEVLREMDLPSAEDVPEEAAWYAYECRKGPWVECFKRGHWSVAYDYDMRSAYGYFLGKLLDIRLGAWVHIDSYVSMAHYGYCKGRVTIDKPFSPIVYDDGGQLYTPVGTWETYLTKGEIDFINKWGLGKFEIEDGWWWCPESVETPLYKEVDRLHMQKQVGNKQVKRVLSGIWGKLLETPPLTLKALLAYIAEGRRNYFNPVWGAEVEVETRLAVAEFVLSNDMAEHVLSVAVDGVLAEHSAAIDSNNTIGSWRLSYECPTVVISSGLNVLQDRKGIGGFAVQYDWLQKQARNAPSVAEYTLTRISSVTLGKAMEQGKFKQLGELEEVTRVVSVNREMKRWYEKEPRNGKELLSGQYRSEPLEVSMIMEAEGE